MATATEVKPLVNYRVEEGLAVIEMNDPPANTYTYEMNRQLDEAILNARMDNNAHVMLHTGVGDKFFSAGANIKMLSSVDPTFKYYFCLHANEMLLRLEHTPKLVIAAINGHCVGGGLEIAMACDLRIARKDAGKIGLPEVNLGVLPGTGGTQRLSRLVGKSRAIELMVTGNTFTFEEAKEMGIINDIFERENFMENVLDYARQFCPPNKAAKAVGRIKRAVQTGWEIPMESALAVERENQQLLFQSEDAKEGLKADVEMRRCRRRAKRLMICKARGARCRPASAGAFCGSWLSSSKKTLTSWPSWRRWTTARSSTNRDTWICPWRPTCCVTTADGRQKSTARPSILLTTLLPTRCASPSAWWPLSFRGIFRCCWPPGSWGRRWPAAALSY